MRFQKAASCLSVAEAVTAAICCLLAVSAAHQSLKRETVSFKIVPGVCSSTTSIAMAAAPRSTYRQIICCRGTGYRLAGSLAPGKRLSSYRCCYNENGHGAVYDPMEDTCCAGKIFPTSGSGRDLKCCNGESLYNTSTQYCCVDDGSRESQIHPKPQFAEHHHFCCGKELYNDLNQICCHSADGLERRVHTIPHNEAEYLTPKVTTCCGTAVYKTNSDLTCHDDTLTNKASLCAKALGSEKLNSSHLCCSGLVATHADHTCCRGVLHRLTPGSRCCGSHYVNENDYLCCNETAHPHHGSEDLECCGSEVYNQSTHRCHNNKAMENVHGLHGMLCSNGSETYVINPSVHICCNGKPFRKEHHLCCDRVAHWRSNVQTLSCCGSQQYNTATQSCTQKNLVQNIPEEIFECQSMRYNSQELICCDGRLRPKKNGDKCCGKDNFFEKPWVLCCNGKPRYTLSRRC